MESFYDRLLACVHRPEARDGEWGLLTREPAWSGNATWERFIAFAWEGGGKRLLVAVNYGPDQGQCYLRLPWTDLEGRVHVSQDLMHPAIRYERAGGDLARRGLYLDVPGWRYHVFALTDRD